MKLLDDYNRIDLKNPLMAFEFAFACLWQDIQLLRSDTITLRTMAFDYRMMRKVRASLWIYGDKE
jgi:hypothetical protein